MKFFFASVLTFLFFNFTSFAAFRTLILATTTSTVDSGLLDVLIPVFEKQSGYTVKTICVGSGMALEMGRRGEADVLLVHSPEDEEQLVKEEFGINRKAVMHNDFILLGPADDRAGVRAAKNAREAFERIAKSGSFFVSRGDKSGTHAKELSLWPQNRSPFSNIWYLESGQGMGATLMIANQKNAYTLSDRATYLSCQNKIELTLLYEVDKSLLNLYHVIEVNPAKHSKVNAAGAKAFSDFITSVPIQNLIAAFGRGKFIPDALDGNN